MEHKTWGITFSPTGGTKRVAKALLSGMSCDLSAVTWMDICSAETDEVHGGLFSPEDVCVVAVPVFGGRIPTVASERLKCLRASGVRAVAVAVYGNRAYEDALVELMDCLDFAGFTCVAAVAAVAEHSIVREVAAGRPDAADERQLEDFGRRIVAKLQGGGEGIAGVVPGSRPYREYAGAPFHPKARKRACVACGACVKVCPVAAIPSDGPWATDVERCISCMRCVATCPAHVRSIGTIPGMVTARKLRACKQARKENELYV